MNELTCQYFSTSFYVLVTLREKTDLDALSAYAVPKSIVLVYLLPLRYFTIFTLHFNFALWVFFSFACLLFLLPF